MFPIDFITRPLEQYHRYQRFIFALNMHMFDNKDVLHGVRGEISSRFISLDYFNVLQYCRMPDLSCVFVYFVRGSNKQGGWIFLSES